MGLQRYTRRTLGREIGLVVFALIYCMPFYMVFAIALKSVAGVTKTPLAFPSHPVWGNFSTAWQTGGVNGLGHAVGSSLIITVSSVLSLIVLGSLCAYTIARRKGALSNVAYIGFVLGIILPFQLAIIPLYVALHNLGLVGNYTGMIILETGLHMPITVFLYTGFIRALPRDYEEAARVDGAGILRTYATVVFPLLRPVTGTVAVLVGLLVWNEFFVTLIFLSGSHIETLPVALYSFAATYISQWNLLFAGVVISVAPVLAFYLFAQRQLMQGFSGGVKG